jgi:hypothetical protein
MTGVALFNNQSLLTLNQTVMKKLFMSLLLVRAAFCSFAQSSNGLGKFSIGVDGAIPTGDAHELFNYGIGGSFKYEFPVAKMVFVTLSAGYESLHVKSELQEPDSKSSFGFIPIKAGIKPYLDGGFFFEGTVRYRIFNRKGWG